MIAKKKLSDWKGCWIGESWQNDIASRYNTFFAFRKKYSLDHDPREAWLDISADARYKLWINGRFVARGPARSFPWHQGYDSLNVAEYLRKGVNWIAVLVHQFGISNYQYLHRSRTGLIVDGYIKLENDQRLTVATDTSWEVKRAFWFGETPVRKTLCLGFQESCDLTREDREWQNPPPGSARWQPAYYLGHAGIHPWTDMEERGIPQLSEEPVQGTVLAYHVLEKTHEDKKHVNIRFAVGEALAAAIVPSSHDQLPVDSHGWILVPGRAGRADGAHIIIIDYGQIITAFPRIAVRATRDPITIKSAYAVNMTIDGIPLLNDGFGTDNEGAADEVIFPQGDAEWESYSAIGYQYHVVLIETSQSVALRITANQTHYPLTTDPRLFFEDPLLQRMVKISDATLKAVMLDAYTDNSWREQGQWLQDAVGMAKSAFYLYGDALLLRRGLLQWGQTQLPNGILNSVAPQELTFMQLTDYTFVWIEGLHFYYTQTADLDFIKQMIPVIEGIYSAIISGITAENLYISPEDYQMLIDWTEIERKPYTFTLNLLALSALEKSYLLLSVAENPKLADTCLHAARKLRQACSKRFWDESNKAWREWVKPHEAIWQRYNARAQPSGWANIGSLAAVEKTNSQHGNAMALLLGLGDKDQQEGAASYLIRSFVDNGLDTNYLSPMWVDKIFEAVAETADDEQFFAALKACFERETPETRTTWPEQFKLDSASDSGIPACGNSGQGSASSIVSVLYRYILGLYAQEPGWGTCALSVKSGPLRRASGTVRVKQGVIDIEWEKLPVGNALSVKLTLPAGVSCYVVKNGTTLESGFHRFEIPT